MEWTKKTPKNIIYVHITPYKIRFYGSEHL